MLKKMIMMFVATMAAAGAWGAFQCEVQVPAGDVGVSRTAMVTYFNDGTSAIAAPYVRIEAGDNAYIRFSEADAWSKSVEFLATSDQTPASSLRAGETVEIPVFIYTATQEAQMTLSYTQSSTEAFPWSSIGASLKPSYVSDSAWTFALVTLKSRFGTTWDSYLSRLRANADYLAENGRPVRRLDRLLQIEINRALGVDAVLPVLASVTDAARSARGMGLSFTRSYSSAMYGRFTSGILGYGWTDNLSTCAELSSDGKTLVFRVPGGGSYSFTKATGSWKPEDSCDKTVLTESSNAYTLTYQSGTVQTFAKSNMRTSTIADNSGNTLTFTWNGTTLQKLAHTDGQTLTFAYSGGLISSVTDDCGRRTTYTYANSLLTKVTASDGLETLYEYRSADGTAAARALSRIIYPDGTMREFTYDTSSGLVTAISSNGGKETTTISRDGGVVTLTGPDGAATAVKTGVSGEVLETTDALGGVSTKGYTADGLLKSVVSPSGLNGKIEHDALGRVSKSVSAAGTATAFAYEDTFGNLKTVTDAKSHAVTYGYDAKGRGTSVTFADGSASKLEYNSRGDVVKSTNRRGQTVTYAYDTKGRLSKKIWSNGRTFTYAYDAHDNVTTATDSETGTVTMQYDSADRLTKIVYPAGRGFTFSYDSCGRLAVRTSLDGTVERFAYDAQGRLASVTDGNGTTYLKNTYDATTGRLAKQTNGNGTSASYLYDKLGRVVSIEHCAADGKVVESLQYCYDADGRCIRASSLLGEERYEYDKNGQLISVRYPDSPSEAFAYDAVGNRTTANGATYTVNDLNQYTAISGGAQSTATAITYDKDGNMTSLTDANGTTTYTYDTLNRLVSVKNSTKGIDWSCKYDVFGNRVSVTDNGVTTERIYLQGSLPSVAAEYVNGQLKERHIVIGAVRVADLITNNSSLTTKYYHADLIGSTRLVSDGSGAIVDRRAYKAFGETRVGNDTSSTAGYVGTLGVETDSTGLLFMRNRYYSPDLGRFIQMDPIGLCGEDFNLYRYCENTPIIACDINGEKLTWGKAWQFAKDFSEGFCESVYTSIAAISQNPGAFAEGFFEGLSTAAGAVSDVSFAVAAGATAFGAVPVAAAAGTFATAFGAMSVAGKYGAAGIRGENVDGVTIIETAFLGHDAIGLAKHTRSFGKGAAGAYEYFSRYPNSRIYHGITSVDLAKWFTIKELRDLIDGERVCVIGPDGGSSGGGDNPGSNPSNPDNPGSGGGSGGGGTIMNESDWLDIATNKTAKTATYSLGADITLSNPKSKVSNFAGTLEGNGHKITVEGDFLFVKVNGATFEDVTFVGCCIEDATKCEFMDCEIDTHPIVITAEDCSFENCCGVASMNPVRFGGLAFMGSGALVCEAKNCTFTGCNVSGIIKTAANREGAGGTGALVGISKGCSFVNCQSSAIVKDESSSSAGGLVGNSTYSEFMNCSTRGEVMGSKFVGGFVGYSVNDRYSACLADASVTGGKSIGGFAGELHGAIVASCSAAGEVICNSTLSGAAGTVGGFSGLVKDGTIEKSEASGDVSALGADEVGGFVGGIDDAKIQKCYASGNVSGGSFVGGFVGAMANGATYNCYATGAVSATGGESDSAYAGGFAGQAIRVQGSGADCQYCYASGRTTASGGNPMLTIAGGFSPLSIPDSQADGMSAYLDMLMSESVACYWNSTSTGCKYSNMGKGLTATNAKKQSSYAGWDFVNTWKMGSNGPELRDVGPSLSASAASVRAAACMLASQGEVEEDVLDETVNGTTVSHVSNESEVCAVDSSLTRSHSASMDRSLPLISATLMSSVSTKAVATTPRLYCYERYVAVKGLAYRFALSADEDASISVSGLPSGFSFSNGVISGTASAAGTTTMTITANGSAGTTTKDVEFAVIEPPEDFAPIISLMSHPDLRPSMASGWSAPLVVSATSNSTYGATSFLDTDSLYVSWLIDCGNVNAEGTFYICLYVDDVLQTYWYTEDLPRDYYAHVIGYSLGTLSAGTHTVRIVTDATGAVAESNESNNSFETTITVLRDWFPNLSVSSLSASRTSIAISDSVTVHWRVGNNDNGAADKSKIAFLTYKYDDTTENYTLVKTEWIDCLPLAAGGSQEFKKTITGKTLGDGAYSFVVIADGQENIVERDETDNISAVAVLIGKDSATSSKSNVDWQFNKIKGEADSFFLSASSDMKKKATTFIVGQPIYMRCCWWNAKKIAVSGNNMKVRVLLNGDPGVYAERTYFERGYYYYFSNKTPDFLQNLPAGDYTLTAVLDSENAWEESNEKNNVKTISFTVVGTPKIFCEAMYHCALNEPVSWPITVDGKATLTGLPSGLKYSGGAIVGKARKVGTYTVNISTKNEAGTATKSITIRVEDPGFIVSCSAQPNGSSTASNVASGGTVEMFVGVNQVIMLSSIPGKADVVSADATVTAKGLPAGLKLSGGKITGVPTKAGTYAVNVSFKNKLSWTSSFLLNIVVHSLPAWAVGTFNGGGDLGQVSLTVAKTGKLSGKYLSDGLTWSLAANSFDSIDESGEVYRATLIGKSGKLAMTNEVGVACDAIGGYVESLDYIAFQNNWKFEPWKMVGKPFAKAAALEYEDSASVAGVPVPGVLTLKFAASGAVTVKGSFVTGVNERTGKDILYTASGSAVLAPQSEPDETGVFDGIVFVYLPPKAGKFDGYIRCIAVRWTGDGWIIKSE